MLLEKYWLSRLDFKFNEISWIKENVKTLGVHHGYNVDNDKIWKDIIDRMKNCVQVYFLTKVKL